jgi:hypothetical protein
MRRLALLILLVLPLAALAQPNQDTLWTRVFGGTRRDIAYDVREAPDHGFILVGTEGGTVWGAHGIVIRVDSIGHSLWTLRTDYDYGGTFWHGIALDWNNNWVVAGRCNEYSPYYAWNLCAAKLNDQGNQLWWHQFGDLDRNDWAYDIEVDTLGGCRGYIVSGFTDSHSFDGYSLGFQTLLLYLDREGRQVWAHAYNMVESPLDCSTGTDVVPTNDGGALVVGFSGDWLDCNADYGSVSSKTDAQGQREWLRNYTYHGLEAFASGVVKTRDGGYIICGSADYHPPLNFDWTVRKCDSTGNSTWVGHSGLAGNDEAAGIDLLPDGGCVITGYCTQLDSSQDLIVVRLDSLGNVVWERTYGYSDDECGWAIRRTYNGTYIIAGYTTSYDTGPDPIQREDMWIIRIDPDHVLDVTSRKLALPESYDLTAYPNPFNPFTEIVYTLPRTQPVSLKVFDLLGREVSVLSEGLQTAGVHRVTFDGSRLPSGVYLYRLDAGGTSQTKKMVLLK